MPIIKIKYVVDDKDLLGADKNISKADKSTEKLRKETDKLNKEMKETGTGGSKAMLTLKNAIGLISFAAIIAGAVQLGKKMIEISAQFQRFGAVLETTLGSKSKAQLAMAQIVKFASETPFQVSQLTDAFVKLANQGFVATATQLRKLGDLAASTGKGFDQLAEAVIDAQTGEFERLKEFGIRAAKQGDQVTFTFKGVETQVQFTSEAIRGYILALGEAQGVSGSMAKISETLGGKLSNLGDNMDRLFVLLGKQTDGPLSGSLELLSKFLDVLNKGLEQGADERLGKIAERFSELQSSVEGLSDQGALQLQLNLSAKVVQDIGNKLRGAEDAAVKAEISLGENSATAVRLRDAWADLNVELEAQKALQTFISDKLTEINDKNLKRADAMDRAVQAEKESIIVTRKLIQDIERLNEFAEGEMFRKWAEGIEGDLIPAFVDLDSIINETIKEGDKAIDEIVRNEQEGADRVYDIWKESYDKRKQLQRDVAVAGLEIAQMFLEATIQKRELDFEDLNRRKELELTQAGDNEEAKAAIQRRYDQEEKQIRNRAAQEQKEATLKKILIENAFGIAKAIAAAPPPINIPLIAIQTALGLAQYGIAASTPAYKEGGYTGDYGVNDVAGIVHGREYVTTAANTAKSRKVLEAIDSGQLSDKTYKQMMSGVPAQMQGNIFDDTRMVSAIKENKPPDVIRIANELYEIKKKGDNYKERIRRKML